MQWLHEPPEWHETDDTLEVLAAGHTDFWRRTHDGGIRDNGHFYYGRVDGDFSAVVQVTGGYREQYDQAGLMVRVDDANWLKCGIELKDGVQYASVVVTRDWSDWSVVRLDQPDSIWFKVDRTEDTIEVAFSLDGRRYQLLRQTFLSHVDHVAVGPMIAAPQGNGFRAVFRHRAIRTN